jgi:hypothetical protein
LIPWTTPDTSGIRTWFRTRTYKTVILCHLLQNIFAKLSAIPRAPRFFHWLILKLHSMSEISRNSLHGTHWYNSCSSMQRLSQQNCRSTEQKIVLSRELCYSCDCRLMEVLMPCWCACIITGHTKQEPLRHNNPTESCATTTVLQSSQKKI